MTGLVRPVKVGSCKYFMTGPKSFVDLKVLTLCNNTGLIIEKLPIQTAHRDGGAVWNTGRPTGGKGNLNVSWTSDELSILVLPAHNSTLIQHQSDRRLSRIAFTVLMNGECLSSHDVQCHCVLLFGWWVTFTPVKAIFL